MSRERTQAWEILFGRALEIMDSVAQSGTRFDDWSFGGGTVLMRRYRHRISKDVDIFVPDPQYLGYVNPRLNDTADALASSHLETAISVKLYFPEGEIDFIASKPLTDQPTTEESILGRTVRVETTAEILAKKVWHRGWAFTARDFFDFALVATRDPAAVESIRPILKEREKELRARIASGDKALRTAFAALDVMEFNPDFDECVGIVEHILDHN
jgi:hypothetical protein